MLLIEHLLKKASIGLLVLDRCYFWIYITPVTRRTTSRKYCSPGMWQKLKATEQL